MRDACITAAVRTPVGRAGGALADVGPDDLAALAVRACVERGLVTMCIGVGQGMAMIVERTG